MLKVVDENVIIVANDLTQVSLGRPPRCPEATDRCREQCMIALQTIIEKGGLILDQESEFFEKYKTHAEFAGQPGVGDAFLRFAFERGYDPAWVTRVKISDESGYLLPAQFVASGFDNDDLLWVAAAYNASSPSKILNACDSDYRQHAAALNALPVTVSELCPDSC